MARLEGVPGDIALLTGPMLLGNFFGYGLFGILVVQLFMYHYRFPKDPLWIKTLVWFLFVIDTLITVLATIAAWNMLAQGWGKPATLTPLDWPFGGIPLLSGLVASCVHFFFCWRLWKLRGAMLIPVIIATISLLTWATASYCGIHGRSLGILRLKSLKPYVIVWLGGSTLVDSLIAGYMVLILFQASSRTAFQATSSLLHKLITLTIETGLATGLAALAELVLFIVFPENNMHFIPFLMLAKLYSNTLLATLNARGLFHQDAMDGSQVIPPPLWNDSSFSLPHHLQTRPLRDSMSGTGRTSGMADGESAQTDGSVGFAMAVIKDSSS
ncbi:hypothetical protein Hypma_014756 [Hypsizygus marmoreus]|uniref:DUF6534 domain-containing protein n=1 Tax=Hypsizygus marmoreus TaxID=39966 RepID=A0A369J9G5_HYPMA|nr:hypothetical protein Hypma_014756 [Hypsizygus marmoreus]